MARTKRIASTIQELRGVPDECSTSVEIQARQGLRGAPQLDWVLVASARHTIHLMAKAAVSVYEAVVEIEQQQER